MTANEFWEWLSRQERGRRFELLDGVVVESPLRGERNGVVCAWLGFLVTRHLMERRTGRVMNSVALLVGRSPDTLLRPDLLAFDSSKFVGGVSDSFCTRTPDLAVEVVSADDQWPWL